MNEIVNDSSKLLKLRSNSTICRENKLKNSKDDNIYLYGFRSDRKHGNLKTHKLKSKTDEWTFRPIVSSMGTYNYELEKCFGKLLNPIIPSQHCATDSLAFCVEIQKVSGFNQFMISYDLCSLFTNIPLKETIKLAVNLIFKKTSRNKNRKETAY